MSGRIRDGLNQKGLKRGQSFKHLCCLYFSFMISIKRMECSPILTLKWFNIRSNGDKMRDKRSFYQRGWIVFGSCRIFRPVLPDFLEKSWRHCQLGTLLILISFSRVLRPCEHSLSNMKHKCNDFEYYFYTTVSVILLQMDCHYTLHLLKILILYYE